ncbi:MAG: ADOP family duplicated permease [Terriglobales bacterium]
MTLDLARRWRRDGALAAVIIATLGLGIGVNLAIFSALDAVVLGTLPVPRPGQIYFARHGFSGGSNPLFSYRLFRGLRHVIAQPQWAAFTDSSDLFSRARNASPRPVAAQLISGGYFAALGVQPWRGRLLNRADDRRPDGRAVAVLSYRYWRGHYLGSEAPALGRRLTLNGVPLTIVGVAPPGFYGLDKARAPAVWAPLRLQSRLRYEASYSIDSGRGPYNARLPWATQAGILWLRVVARMPKRADVGGIGAAATAVEHRALAPYLAHADAKARRQKLRERVWLVSGRQGLGYLRQEWAQPLGILLTMSALVLLIACGDVALLLLARAVTRRREWAVRLALGAHRRRVAAAELAGSLVLAATGSGLGLGLAMAARQPLLRFLGGLHLAMPLDARMLGFCVAAAVLTGLLFGGVPALRAARVELAPALKSDSGSGLRRREGFGRWLISGQAALSVVLLLGAALLALSLVRLMRLKPGFAAREVVAMTISPHAAGYAAGDMGMLARRLRRRLAALPGADGAAVAASGLLMGYSSWSTFFVSPARGQWHRAGEDFVSPSFFRVLGIPVVRGRVFNRGDGPGTPSVVAVNRAFVRRYLRGRNPLGAVVNDFGDATIVAVVGNVRASGPAQQAPPTIYHPWAQRNDAAGILVPHFLAVRIRGDATAAFPEIRKTLAAVAPNLPVTHLATLRHALDRRLWNERVIAELSGAFALLALLLAALGLYGVVAYTAARREAEVGLRIALGARPGQILRLMLGSATVMVASGAAAGLAAGLIAAQVLRSQLHGLSPLDPAAIGAAVVALFAVALAAAAIPARRAAKIQPWQALRRE